MKIIITESQLKTTVFQNAIDMALEDVDENCGKGYYVRSYLIAICDPLEMIEEIKVVDVSKSTSTDNFGENKMDIINIKVNCYIDSRWEYNDLDTFIYELQEEVRNIIGTKFVTLEVEKIINKRKDFNW